MQSEQHFPTGYTRSGNICVNNLEFTTNMFPSDCGCTPSATASCDHTIPAPGSTRDEAGCFVTSVEDLQATANANTADTPCSLSVLRPARVQLTIRKVTHPWPLLQLVLALCLIPIETKVNHPAPHQYLDVINLE